MADNVHLPLTGTGDADAVVATEQIGTAHFQAMKLTDGTPGSSAPIVGASDTPESTAMGLVVRQAGPLAVTGAVGITSGSSAVGITSGSSEVALTSVGSTRLVGRVTVDNPTTAVTVDGSVAVSNPTTLVTVDGTVNITNSTNQIGAVTVLNLSTAGGSTQVDANLSSEGSTKLVGRVTVENPTTAVNVANPTTAVNVANPTTAVNVANPTTLVNVSSGLVLGPSTAAIGQISSGTQTIGTVLNATSTNQIGSVSLLAGSTNNNIGAVSVANPTTTVGLSSGSSATPQITDGYSYSSLNTSRTTVNTSAAAQVIGTNTARRGMAIQNLTTVDVALGFPSTAALTTALANVSYILGSRQNLIFGAPGGSMPNYTGPIQGITIGSTTVSGGVAVTQFTNT